MAARISIRVSRGCGWKLPFQADELERLLLGMLRAAVSCFADQGPAIQGGIDVLVIGDQAMERLHRQSTGCLGPTNVLSFPASAYNAAPPGGSGNVPGMLGSLALSVDTLNRECFLYGQDPREHCIRLLAHGLAHLLGFEHGEAMWELTACMERAAESCLEDA